MTNHYELTKAYKNKNIVLICIPCLEEKKDFPLQSLDGWLNWEPYRLRVEYKNYSHGYCPNHYRLALEQLGVPPSELEKEIDWDEELGIRVVDKG